MISLGKPLEQILGIGALIVVAVGCALVLWPFLTALIWAAVICFSTWPIYRWCEQALGGRRGLAATLMTLLVALVLVAPFAIMVTTLADSVVSLVHGGGPSSRAGPTAATALGRGVPSGWREPSLPIGTAWPITHPPSSSNSRS